MTNRHLDIQDRVLGFYQSIVDDPYHRYRSWEHCYRFFSQQPADTDLACLHLGFYLASWGMYRGSAFLLQKDYRVHRPVVEELCKAEYQGLRAVSLTELQSARGAQHIATVMGLVHRIKQCYIELIGHGPRAINVTDTLATKILLGTLGCTPAYDRYFIEGLKHRGLSFSYLNARNFRAMVNYCLSHQSEILEVQQSIFAHCGLHYPDMKVIDMYFWMLGASDSEGVE